MTPFVPATKEKAWVKLAIFGPSGSGKTLSSLLLAYGMVGSNGKIAMIDTENQKGAYYANVDIGAALNTGAWIGHKLKYDILTLTPPFTSTKFIDAIFDAERAGYDVVIIDSFSMEWTGAGGILEGVDKVNANNTNKMKGWADATPKHQAVLQAIIQSQIHVIATMRAKTEWVMEKDDRTGKNVPRKLGLTPVQRQETEYEFTAVLHQHPDNTTTVDILHGVSHPWAVKDNFKITPENGMELINWMGKPPVRIERAEPATPAEAPGEEVNNAGEAGSKVPVGTTKPWGKR